ncbi:MAG: fibrobacter succinogenes major paralogous domain-containing protein [Ferruginibacter sp.]
MKKILSSLALIILIAACKKTELAVQSEQEIAGTSAQKSAGATTPTVTTNAATFVTSATATSGGSVSSGGGGSQVTERGVCYSTSPNPTTANTKVPSGSGSGNFVSILRDLSGSTTYYVRAYAIKNGAAIYGSQVLFTTLINYGTVTDFDGNVYNTITIGSQVWTTSNLKTTHYRDGTFIPNVTDDMAWYDLSTGAYCNYNNNETNATTYGRLYNWFAVNDAHNLAPAGWHVASYSEWYTTLPNSLGGCNVAGKKLKDNVLWNGDNSSGFKAIPAGARITGSGPNGPFAFFSAMGLYGYWWTTTQLTNPDNAWFFEQDANESSCGLVNPNYNKKTGYSIRLVKD